ncbi:hypothetical protein [Streptomyces sp. NPDC093260]|uniref:hypothetical protein n=1 Tax=Streptomyces sp. NPDC093260 TaxID=3155073 RepID=UPI003449B678
MGEGAVAADSAFAAGDGGRPDSEAAGGSGEGDVLGMAQGRRPATPRTAAAVVGQRNVSRAMARFDSRMISFSVRPAAVRRATLSRGIAGHADEGDAVEGGVGRPVAAA